MSFVVYSVKNRFKKSFLGKIGAFTAIVFLEAVIGIISLPFYLVFNRNKFHLLSEGVTREKAEIYRPHYRLRKNVSVVACVFVLAASIFAVEVDHISKDADLGEAGKESYVILEEKTIAQATDGSGYLSFDAAVGFLNADKQALKVEYSDNGEKDFYVPKLISVKSDTKDLVLKEDGGIINFSGVDTSDKIVGLNFIWDTKTKENGNGSLDGVKNCEMNLRLTLVEKIIVKEETPEPVPGILEPVREEIPAEETKDDAEIKEEAPVEGTEEKAEEVSDVVVPEKPKEEAPAEKEATPSKEAAPAEAEAVVMAIPEGVGGPDDLVEISPSGFFCLDNQSPTLISSELTYASNSIKVIFDEAMAVEKEIDFSKLAIASRGPEKKSYGLAGSTPVWQDAVTLTISLSDEAKDYLHSGPGEWVSSSEVALLAEGESGLTDIFGNLTRGLSADDSAKMNVITEGFGTELPPQVVKDEPKDEKVATPSDEPPPKEIVRNSGENSCKVSPSTQIFKAGGIGYYTVNVTSASPNSTFKLLTGRLPAGVTLKFDKNSGKGDENIKFSVLLPENMRTGLFKGIVVDDFTNPDGDKGQSFCLFNIRVE